jgi:xanthine/CO dehydrogenase XdhC/CoxF family maturation factor
MSTQAATPTTPPTISDDAVLRQAAAWRGDGRTVAIATVINTWGSSPRPVGSQLVVNEKSQFVGSVSGGCIEGAVVEEALKVMKSGEPSLLEFGVSDEMAWEVGLACGGRVEVFVERVEP